MSEGGTQSMVSVNNLNHVFIFGVCGRCSSTALQRILNSSNEICIWGEQHYILEEIINIIDWIDYFVNHPIVVKDTGILHKCIQDRNHLYPDFPYMHAMGNLSKLKTRLIEAINIHLKPPAEGITRFGFKDIRLKRFQTLIGLKTLFPKCKFVFLFRNPTRQWLSVKHNKFWDYSDNLNDFLEEYLKISSILLKFHKEHPDSLFMEDTILENSKIFEKILELINIEKVNPRVIDRKYSSLKTHLKDNKFLTLKREIESHLAFKNYTEMQGIQERLLF